MSVCEEIKKIIESQGFIAIDQFMQIAMTGTHSSYYRSKQPLGETGDFITAPEISQIFGEMLAIWCIDSWHKLGKPQKCNLLEYGAGIGTLIRDLLRMAKMDREFYDALDIWIIDINPILQEAQKITLKQFEDKKIKWVSQIQKISNHPTIILANEFFDALPIKQYEKQKNGWKERILIWDEKKSQLRFALSSIDAELDGLLSTEHPNAANGSICEKSLESTKIIKEICQHISIHKGAALIIDYGYDIDPLERGSHQYMETIQAVKNHKYVDILDDIGESDISAHVDFWALKKSVSELPVFGSISQRELLENCGIDIRLESLINTNPALSQTLQNQYHRLMDKDQMGELFKAIAIFSEE